MSDLRLRPHHALCVHFFEGKGYSERFISHMSHIIDVLKTDDPYVSLTSSCDIICEGCPHNIGGVCDTADKVGGFDSRALKAMGLRDGDSLSWSELSRLSKERIISSGKLPEVCDGCMWLSICNRKK